MALVHKPSVGPVRHSSAPTRLPSVSLSQDEAAYGDYCRTQARSLPVLALWHADVLKCRWSGDSERRGPLLQSAAQAVWQAR